MTECFTKESVQSAVTANVVSAANSTVTVVSSNTVTSASIARGGLGSHSDSSGRISPKPQKDVETITSQSQSGKHK